MLPENDIFLSDRSGGRQANRTFKIDFEKKRLDGMTDGIDALSQTVYAILMTPRYAYTIFSHNYGTDYNNLPNGEYIKKIAAIKSAVTDSLMIDDRILSVQDFEFTKKEHSIFVKFSVKSIFGDAVFEKEVM